jgi:hypothetical protein
MADFQNRPLEERYMSNKLLLLNPPILILCEWTVLIFRLSRTLRKLIECFDLGGIWHLESKIYGFSLHPKIESGEETPKARYW